MSDSVEMIDTDVVGASVAALRAGELIVYPTETFYAIGADASSPLALRRLLEVKGREAGKTVAMIAADESMAFGLARTVPQAARALAAKFWPGPLTLVLPARSGLDESLVSSEGGVGVRVSPHPVAREISRRLGRPITATSANRAGEEPARRLSEARSLGDKVKVFVEGGEAAAPAPSTLVSLLDGAARIIREGAISAADVNAVLAALEQSWPSRE